MKKKLFLTIISITCFMMKLNKRLIIIFFAIALFNASCKKQETLNNDEPQNAQLYFPLSTGNYWIYQTYFQNDSGFTTNGSLDSIFIEKDTLINGEKYFKYNRIPPQYDPAFRRDSLGYVIDETGRIFFSVNNFTDTLYSIYDSTSNIYLMSYKMESKDTIIDVDAGSFKCYDYRGFYYSIPPYSDLFGSPRLTHDFYAPSIGLLKKVYFFSSSPYITEKRLVRFGDTNK